MSEALNCAVEDLEASLSRQEIVRGEGVAVVRCQGLRLVLDALPRAPIPEGFVVVNGEQFETELTEAVRVELEDGGADVPYGVIADRVAARVSDALATPEASAVEGGWKPEYGALLIEAKTLLNQIALNRNRLGPLATQAQTMAHRLAEVHGALKPSGRDGE